MASEPRRLPVGQRERRAIRLAFGLFVLALGVGGGLGTLLWARCPAEIEELRWDWGRAAVFSINHTEASCASYETAQRNPDSAIACPDESHWEFRYHFLGKTQPVSDYGFGVAIGDLASDEFGRPYGGSNPRPVVVLADPAAPQTVIASILVWCGDPCFGMPASKHTVIRFHRVRRWNPFQRAGLPN